MGESSKSTQGKNRNDGALVGGEKKKKGKIVPKFVQGTGKLGGEGKRNWTQKGKTEKWGEKLVAWDETIIRVRILSKKKKTKLV